MKKVKTFVKDNKSLVIGGVLATVGILSLRSANRQYTRALIEHRELLIDSRECLDQVNSLAICILDILKD